MNYKDIFTKEAVEQFRKEGAAFVAITLFNVGTSEQGAVVIRDMEVDLREDDRHFAIAGRTTAAETAMAAVFNGNIVNGEKWFPFHLEYKAIGADRILAKVARVAGLNPTDLKWSFINGH